MITMFILNSNLLITSVDPSEDQLRINLQDGDAPFRRATLDFMKESIDGANYQFSFWTEDDQSDMECIPVSVEDMDEDECSADLFIHWKK